MFLHQIAVALLTFSLRPFRPLTLGDVRHNCSTPTELPVFVLYCHRLQLGIELSAVFSHQLDFAGLLGLSLKDLLKIQVVSIPELLTDKAREGPIDQCSVSL